MVIVSSFDTFHRAYLLWIQYKSTVLYSIRANATSSLKLIFLHFRFFLQAEDFETAQRQISDQLQIISELRHQNTVSGSLLEFRDRI